MNCPHGVPCDNVHTCEQCCAHTEVLENGACARCGEQVTVCDTDIVIARLARCEHKRRQVFAAPASRIHVTICNDCGAARIGKNAPAWVAPRFVGQAKELDHFAKRIGMAPDEGMVDSDQKNVIPIKSRT